jgi:hypothetical protein
MSFEAYTNSGQSGNTYQQLPIKSPRDPISFTIPGAYYDIADPDGGTYRIDRKWLNQKNNNYWRYQGNGVWVMESDQAGAVLSFATDLSDPTVLSTDIAVPQGTSIPVAGIMRLAGDNGIKTVQPTMVNGVTIIRFIRGNATTSDGGGQTKVCVDQEIPNNTALTIQIVTSGLSLDGFGVGAYGTAIVKNVGGTCTLVNTTGLLVSKDSAIGSANVTVTISGTFLLVNVTGQAGKTINWTTCLPGISVSPAF